MAKRTCITCKAKGVDKDKTPLWSKKDGLYSMLPRILNCEDKYNPHKTELEETTPEIVGTEVSFEIELEEKNNWIFYWAAEAGASLDGDKPDGAAKSYGDESNHGLSKVDSDGKATITLNCPKLYMEDDTLFPRHVHYTVLTKDKVWSTTIGTYEITCKIPFETMKKIQEKRTYMIMNALSKEAYDEAHIPNSILCHHESLDSLGKQKKAGILKKLINQNLSAYPPVKKFVKDVDDTKQIPIVVYCASEKCNASEKLVEHLYSCGFFNVVEYPGGVEEWSQKSNKTSLFEDADDTEVDMEEEEEQVEEKEIELDEEDELYIYDGVEYIHKLDGSDEILYQEDLSLVGNLIDQDIEWINSTEYEKHLQRKSEKGGKAVVEEDDEEIDEDGEDEQEEDEEDEDEEDEDGADEQEEEEQEEDEDGEDEDGEDEKEQPIDEETSDEEEDDPMDEGMNESMLQSKTTKELQSLFERFHKMQKSLPKKKQDMVRCILECNKLQKGGGLYSDSIQYGGTISQTMYDNSFRGWGFTFNM